MKGKKIAHGDIRDLGKIGGNDFKNGMLEVTEEELQIREMMQTTKKGENRLNKGDSETEY